MCFLFFVVGAVMNGKLPFAVLLSYLVMCAVTYIAYYFDKEMIKLL